MSVETKKWTLEELKTIEVGVNMQRHRIYDKKNVIRWVAFRKDSSDGLGSFLVKLFKRSNDHFEEIDVSKESNRMAKILGKSVSKTTIIREVLVELGGDRFCELLERLEKKPKVTMGIRKGSCVFLYIRGKQGPKQVLQITN